MKIRDTSTIGSRPRFDAASAKETLHDLEVQYANGEFETRAYSEKKRSLVRLFLKATTSPQRKYRGVRRL